MPQQRTSTARDVSIELVNRLKERRANPGAVWGIPWPFPGFNALTGGIHKEEMTIMMARPGVGKTSIACQIALSIAEWAKAEKIDKVVRVVSAEMSPASVQQRILCMKANVSSRKVREGRVTDEEADRYIAAAREMAMMPIEYLEPTSIDETVTWLKAANEKPTLWFVVDYLQKMPYRSGASANAYQKTSEISAMLTETCLKVAPGLVLAQMNRDSEKRADRRPQLSDLRDSGTIEQDASNVWGIYREDVYNKLAQEFAGDPKDAELWLLKQRNGPNPAMVPAIWFPPLMTYVDSTKSHEEQDEYAPAV